MRDSLRYSRGGDNTISTPDTAIDLEDEDQKELTRFQRFAKRFGWKPATKSSYAELLWMTSLLSFFTMAIIFTINMIDGLVVIGGWSGTVFMTWLKELGTSFTQVVLGKMQKYYNERLDDIAKKQ